MNRDNEWLYENVCPWCGELYAEVDHSIGCPEPDPLYNPERQKFLRDFVESLTAEYLARKQYESQYD